MSNTHPFTTTAFEFPGFRTVKSFGVVRGIVVRSRSIIGNFGAMIQSFFGGNISIYTSLCERAREDAFQQMLTHASQLGANAVVGIRYDATEIGALRRFCVTARRCTWKTILTRRFKSHGRT